MVAAASDLICDALVRSTLRHLRIAGTAATPAVIFQQQQQCLNHRGDGNDLVLGSCTGDTASWKQGTFIENTKDPEGGKQRVPTLVGGAQGLCIHLRHHDKNGTCDGNPAINLPVMQKCAHGNAFRFTHVSAQGGEVQNLNCGNWGQSGACLVSTPHGTWRVSAASPKRTMHVSRNVIGMTSIYLLLF